MCSRVSLNLNQFYFLLQLPTDVNVTFLSLLDVPSEEEENSIVQSLPAPQVVLTQVT